MCDSVTATTRSAMLGVGRHEGTDENFGGDKEGLEEDSIKRRRKPTLSTKGTKTLFKQGRGVPLKIVIVSFLKGKIIEHSRKNFGIFWKICAF